MVPKSSWSNRGECITGMKHKATHHSCGLAPVMQATSRRRADFAKRMCCRNPAVLGDHPEHSSSSAANNPQKTSTTVVQQLTRVITGFGSKKPLASPIDSPASIVRETVQGFRCKSTVNRNVLAANATAHDLEVPEALLEHPDAPSISLPYSCQGLRQ